MVAFWLYFHMEGNQGILSPTNPHVDKVAIGSDRKNLYGGLIARGAAGV